MGKNYPFAAHPLSFDLNPGTPASPVGLQGYGCSSGSQETTASQRAPRQSLELNHSCTCRQVGAPLDRASTQRLKGYHSAGEVRITPTEGGLDVSDSLADRVQHMEHLESVEPTSGSIRCINTVEMHNMEREGTAQALPAVLQLMASYAGGI